MIPYISLGGIKWQRSDVDGPNTGRGLNGQLIRDRLGIKRRLDVTCKPLTTSEASRILTAIEPEWVTVTFTDPMSGTTVTKTMYSNNIPASIAMIKDGVEYWNGITFPLIEK